MGSKDVLLAEVSPGGCHHSFWHVTEPEVVLFLIILCLVCFEDRISFVGVVAELAVCYRYITLRHSSELVVG
jgi:hypothetical protein